MTSAPYAYAQSLVPLMIARLSNVADLGIRVGGLAEELNQAGYGLGDAVIISPSAMTPIQGQGNAARGFVTMTCTFVVRIDAKRQSRLFQVSDMVFQRLSGWEIQGGMVLNYGGSELTIGAENNPTWVSTQQWAVTFQAAPLRPA